MTKKQKRQKKHKKHVSFRTYLSGSMANRLVEHVTAERHLAINLCAKAGMYAVDPADSEQKLWKPGKKAKISTKFPPKVMQAFVRRDKYLIRHCDALLVMTGDTPSDGTWWEMAYAHQIGIPIIMIAPKRQSGQIMGWSNFLVDDLVSDLTTAIRLIKRKYFHEKIVAASYWEDAIKNAKRAVKHKKRTHKKAQQRRAQKLAKRLVKEASEKIDQRQEIKPEQKHEERKSEGTSK